jgi:serine/threonine-protein kinase
MGLVYKARDPKIDRTVAIKTIFISDRDPDLARSYRDRFFIEAKAAGRLSHPGIVAVYDMGEEPDTHEPFIVMEYVQGQSLERMLALSPGGLPETQVLHIIRQVADALDYAHSLGVVHRDIKPANILITDTGCAKVADFGVATLQEDSSRDSLSFGTPAFMSPEQFTGAETDGRSDLFSLGAVLYTALAGYRPFQGSGNTTVSFKVVNRDPVPVFAFRPTVSEGVDYVIQRAIAKDPYDRYQSGAEISDDLGDLIAGKRPRSSGPSTIDSQNFTFLEAIAPRAKVDLTKVTILAAPQHLPSASQAERQPYRRGRKMILATCALAELAVGVILIRDAAFSAATPAPPAVHMQPPAPPAVEISHVRTRARVTPAKSKPDVELEETAGEDIQPATLPEQNVCSVDVQVEHPFKQGYMSIWADDELISEFPLFGSPKSRLGIFRTYSSDDSTILQIPAGIHDLKIEVRSQEDGFLNSQTLTSDFVAATAKILRVRVNKRERSMQVSVVDPLPSITSSSGSHPAK